MKASRVPAVLLLALLPLSLFGAANEEAAAGGEASGSGFIWKVVNFAVLFGALIFFLRKPVGAMLTKKTEVVRDILDDARREREKAESKLADAQARAAALEIEAGRLKAQALAEGQAATEKIKALSAQEAERIRTLATQEVAIRLQAGIRELKEYTTELAADLAEDRIQKRLTGADQASLIDRSIERLKNIHDESAAR